MAWLKKSKVSKDNHWKLFQKDLDNRLLLDRVQHFIAKGDVVGLEEVLDECSAHKLDKSDTVVHGRFMLAVIKTRKALDFAVSTGHFDRVALLIDKIETRGGDLHRELQHDVSCAKSTIKQLGYFEERERKLSNVMPIDRKTLSELRRYSKPTRMVHRMVQGILLLLMGVDEITTSNWTKCTKLLTNYSVKRGMMEFDVYNIHPEIMARVKQILQDEKYHIHLGCTMADFKKNHLHKYAYSDWQNDRYWTTINLQAVQSASPAATAFYIWAMEVLEKYFDSEGEWASPASPRKQREILQQD